MGCWGSDGGGRGLMKVWASPLPLRAPVRTHMTRQEMTGQREMRQKPVLQGIKLVHDKIAFSLRNMRGHFITLIA